MFREIAWLDSKPTVFAALITAWLAIPASLAPAAPGTPFDALLGSWSGSGQFRMEDGRAERITCNAYYTGGGNQMRMVVRCKGQTNDINLRSQLSLSGGRVSGNWEESVFSASGSASGQATSNRIRLAVSGTAPGTMTVTFSQSRQDIAIAVQGIPLKSVKIGLSRK